MLSSIFDSSHHETMRFQLPKLVNIGHILTAFVERFKPIPRFGTQSTSTPRACPPDHLMGFYVQSSVRDPRSTIYLWQFKNTKQRKWWIVNNQNCLLQPMDGLTLAYSRWSQKWKSSRPQLGPRRSQQSTSSCRRCCRHSGLWET